MIGIFIETSIVSSLIHRSLALNSVAVYCFKILLIHTKIGFDGSSGVQSSEGNSILLFQWLFFLFFSVGAIVRAGGQPLPAHCCVVTRACHVILLVEI